MKEVTRQAFGRRVNLFSERLQDALLDAVVKNARVACVSLNRQLQVARSVAGRLLRRSKSVKKSQTILRAFGQKGCFALYGTDESNWLGWLNYHRRTTRPH